MKNLITTVMANPLTALVMGVRAAGVGLFFGGIHWLAWHYLAARHAFMVDVWLGGSGMFGLLLAALYRWEPARAERVLNVVALMLAGPVAFVIAHEIASSLVPSLLRSVDVAFGTLAVVSLVAGVWAIFNPQTEPEGPSV